MGNGAGTGKALSKGKPFQREIHVPNSASIYAEIEMVLRARMETVKQSPVPPLPVAIPIGHMSYIAHGLKRPKSM